MKADSSCLFQEMAAVMAGEPSIKAVKIDLRQRSIDLAFIPPTARLTCEERLRAILNRRRSEQIDCTEENGGCGICLPHQNLQLPPGIHFRRLGEQIVLLEKESCPTGPKFWTWSSFFWPKFETRVVSPTEDNEEEWKTALLLATLCGILTSLGFAADSMAGTPHWVATALYLGAYLTGGWHPLEETWELLRKRVLDVHFLMLCVAAGAAFIGHWWEGAILLFLFSLSGALEHMVLARTQREIRSLFKAAPKEATVVDAGAERRVAVSDLRPGMILRVRPGESFAVDAEVINGKSAADESNLTGESTPVEKQPGDLVLSGTLNLWGLLEARVLRPEAESSLAKIIRLIREAQESKAPAQRFTDLFGTRYTYAILALSIASFFFWWLVSDLPPFLSSGGQTSAFYRAMTLLVVASPCALVLSIPSAVLAGIACGARRGILFRGGAAIEQLAEVHRVVLDKTGTLTTGEMEVVALEADTGQAEDLLSLAAALAHNSSHPVSRAIYHSFLKRGRPLPVCRDFTSSTGYGILGLVDDQPAKLGRRSFFPPGSWVEKYPQPDVGVTEAFFETAHTRGRLLVRDTVRESSAPLLAKLLRQGLHVTMLTGDRPEAAARVARQVGLKDFKAGLLPEDKVSAIRAWTARGEKVAMVGDGVNDAPSLAAAHVAIGMGLRGSDAVLEQADIVLMQDKLENVYTAYRISQKARQVIRQNLFISLGVIILLVLSALGGWIPLTMGVLGHEGSTVIVVLNSLRILLHREEA